MLPFTSTTRPTVSHWPQYKGDPASPNMTLRVLGPQICQAAVIVTPPQGPQMALRRIYACPHRLTGKPWDWVRRRRERERLLPCVAQGSSGLSRCQACITTDVNLRRGHDARSWSTHHDGKSRSKRDSPILHRTPHARRVLAVTRSGRADTGRRDRAMV